MAKKQNDPREDQYYAVKIYNKGFYIAKLQLVYQNKDSDEVLVKTGQIVFNEVNTLKFSLKIF